ncbi:uncharacterized protein LOC143486769 [Brachyhypopomus gauderio]|uniref:uncharacterized protein LOC143486769 n=1 Tax=Brachyhypopomus gauderio TaxID=698409 RepID=UPI00404230E4
MNSISSKQIMRLAGCTLSESPGAELIKYPGESVLLPCFCTDPNTKPANVKWEHLISSTESAWTEVSNGTRHHRDRVHMSHQNHPANLSLLLSNLTEEDQGTYRCTVNNQSISIRLSIKGCTLLESPMADLIKYPGESVLLPCFCTDPHTKPASVKWEHLISSTGSAWTEVSNGTRHHRDRVHMSHQNHPANLSLLLFNLTEEDQGTYRCTVNNNNQSISIRLSITEPDSTVNNLGDHQSPTTNNHQTSSVPWKPIKILTLLMSLVLLLVLLVLLVVAGVYCTCVKGRKQNSQEKRGESKHNEDDVVYSSFDHGKKGQRTQREVEESVIYSDTVFGRKRPSAGEECELTYSTVSHAKKGERALIQDNSEEPTVYSSLKIAKKLQVE